MTQEATHSKARLDGLWSEELKALHSIESWGATLFLSSIALIAKQLIDWSVPGAAAILPALKWQIFLLPALVGIVSFTFLRIVNFRIRLIRAGQYAGVEPVGSLKPGSFGLVGWSMASMPLGFGFAVSWYFGISRQEVNSTLLLMLLIAVVIVGISLRAFLWQNSTNAQNVKGTHS